MLKTVVGIAGFKPGAQAPPRPASMGSPPGAPGRFIIDYSAVSQPGQFYGLTSSGPQYTMALLV